MKKLIVLLSLLLIFGCEKSENIASGPIDFIPESSSIIIKINDLETFRTDIENNEFFKQLSSLELYSDVEDKVAAFEKLQTKNDVYFCLEKDQDSINYLLITKQTDSLFRKIQLDSVDVPFVIRDSIFIASNSQRTLDQLQVNERPNIERLLSTSETNKSFSVILNSSASEDLGEGFISDSESSFSNQTFFDVSLTPDQLSVNGITVSNDSIPQLVDVFKNSVPQENRLMNIVPNNAEGYLSITYNDFQNINDNLNAYRQTENDSLFNPELFQTLIEIGQVFYNDSDLVILRSIDPTATKEALRNHMEVADTYRTIEIFNFSENAIFQSVFSPFITANDLSLYTQLDDFFVFSNSVESLQNVISNFQNGTTLGSADAFTRSMTQLSDESSLLIVADQNRLKEMLTNWFQTDASNLRLSDYKISAFQLVQDDGFLHLNGVLNKYKKQIIANTITEMFSVTLDADIIMDPQFVINHRTKEKEIVVQDVNNDLYLISNTGKILWKRRLLGPVLGKIEQVDLYRNGRLQLAFATPSRVYIIDRNGNNVSPFPLKFGDRITQPLSVFDYDKTRRYRFLVTQGTDLLMYDRNGRFVSGFKYINPNTIVTQPKHVRIGSRDYIVFGAGKRFVILNRQGSVRVSVNQSFDLSGEQFYLYNNTFTTTSSDGELIQIDQQGNVSKKNIGLNSDHYIDATAKTLVTLDENILSIKQKSVELDFGDYTRPKIFYINDKIYVSVTDLQEQKIYLFDSQARPIENFPVYGNTTIDLANIDRDRNLEFVTKGESNTIVVYKKN